jgi:3-oxoacyl-[acyl-carrier-protein] synthase II
LLFYFIFKELMAIYIKGMGNISPQKTWEEDGLLTSPLNKKGNRLVAIEPDYSKFIDPKQSRRMSRVIKMGIASAMMALKEASIPMPDGIITGTGYGCQDDTGTFLAKMVEFKEQALNPTPFIQSTHNTIGSQLALLIKCHAYNQTYAHGSFSFENALLDAILQLLENPALSLLVGGIDESIDISHHVLARFGAFKGEQLNSLDVLKNSGAGSLNGEGSAFFVLSGAKDDKAIVEVKGVSTIYSPEQELNDFIFGFLTTHEINADEIDIVLLGKSGDKSHDSTLELLYQNYFSKSTKTVFKHLSGEYPVASAFALWLAARMIQKKSVPNVVIETDKHRPVKNILVLNQYFGTHYSMMLLSDVN